MQKMLSLGLALLLAACATKPSGPKIIVSEAGSADAVPALDCPAGGRAVGLPPPDGSSARCMKILPDGRMVSEGPEIFWYPDGGVKERGYNLNGRRDGKWELFNKSGQKTKEVSYRDGVVNGATREFYPSGGLKSEQQYHAGNLHGVSTHYQPNGKVRATQNFSQGVLHGEAKDYFDNGNMKAKGEYNKNTKSGYWTYWYSSGKVCMKGRMIKGERDGYWAYKPIGGDQIFAKYTQGKTADQPLPEAGICK